MTRNYSIPVWVEEISETAEEELENFSPNAQYQKAVTEILRELEDALGYSAVDELCEAVMESIEEYRRHPKSARIRVRARNMIASSDDAELSPTSPLLKSRNG